MTAGNLSEYCESYYEQDATYARFAECEDAPGLVLDFLAARTAGRSVLDVGCGSGKYAGLLAPSAASYTGVEQSQNLLARARASVAGLPHAQIMHCNAERIDHPNASYELVFASWVLGTVADERRRDAALGEMLRLTAPGGETLLVENDEGGEFEYLRGRYPDCRRTRAYNAWIRSRGFDVAAVLPSYFEFASTSEARAIFGAIWGETAAARVQDRRIEHRIVVYSKSSRAAR